MVDAVFKVVIFGDGGVGKTTLTKRFLTGLFEESTGMTIGVEFHVKHMMIEGKEIALQIWDYAGQERFRFMLNSYALGAKGGIFMYDITHYSSLKNIDPWFATLNHGMLDQTKVPVLLVGSKADLEDQRSVQKEDAEDFVKSRHLYKYIECSSKTGKNVEEVFEVLTRRMMENADLI